MTQDAVLDKNRLLLQWSFPWHVMEVMLGGKSAIDLNVLKIKNQSEANEFVRGYGYDLDNLDDRRFVHGLVLEALHFIQHVLMPEEWAEGIHPPDDILFCDDPRSLLLWASDDHVTYHRRGAWACALLRVMHTISHIESVRHYASVDIAREQILGRFGKFVFLDEAARIWLGVEEQKIELARVDWKTVKSRHSIILKLLHKRANVAETIHDLLGVRLVVRQREDVMLAVKYMRQFYMVTFANTNPARIRNSLIDFTQFKEGSQDLVDKLMNDRITIEEFKTGIHDLAEPSVQDRSDNPHSARDYRSIQLTCRQLIRMENPSLDWVRVMRRALANSEIRGPHRTVLQTFLQFVESRESVKKTQGYSEFFNFEVQIMDEASYAANSYGSASHDKYKKSQIRTARRRVLFEVLGSGNDSQGDGTAG